MFLSFLKRSSALRSLCVKFGFTLFGFACCMSSLIASMKALMEFSSGGWKTGSSFLINFSSVESFFLLFIVLFSYTGVGSITSLWKCTFKVSLRFRSSRSLNIFSFSIFVGVGQKLSPFVSKLVSDSVRGLEERLTIFLLLYSSFIIFLKLFMPRFMNFFVDFFDLLCILFNDLVIDFLSFFCWTEKKENTFCFLFFAWE